MNETKGSGGRRGRAESTTARTASTTARTGGDAASLTGSAVRRLSATSRQILAGPRKPYEVAPQPSQIHTLSATSRQQAERADRP